MKNLFVMCILIASSITAQAQVKTIQFDQNDKIVKAISKKLQLSTSQQEEIKALWVASKTSKKRSEIRSMPLEQRRQLLKDRVDSFLLKAEDMLSSEQFEGLETFFNRKN